MGKRQVAFAHVWYDDDGDERTVHRTAVRGQFVEFPAAEEKRLDELGALVPKGGQLEILGELIPLEESANAEKIANYLMSGNAGEIQAHLGGYAPSLIEKLYVAEKGEQDRADVLAVIQAYMDGAVVEVPAEVVGLEESATDDEIRNYLDASSAKDVHNAVKGKGLDFVTRVLEAEQARPEPRNGVVKSLSKLQEDLLKA